MNTTDNPLYPLYLERQWFLANSTVLQAWLQNDASKVTYGPRGKWVWRLINMATQFHLTLWVIRVIGSLDALIWWRNAGAAGKVLEDHSEVFVGFGAGSEEKMWSYFLQKTNGRAVRLDQTEVKTFGAYHRPKLVTLLKEIWHQSAQAYTFLAKTQIQPVVSYRLDFFTFTAMRMAQYAFHKCWWRVRGDLKIERVVFISADIPAYACLDAGLSNVEFHQHGLLRKSLLMPKFPCMELLTESEKKYYLELMPNSKINFRKNNGSVTDHRRIILIASIYEIPNFSKALSLSVLEDLYKWANTNELRIIIRKHPKENGDFWSNYFPELHIDAIDDSFNEALVRIKPMIMLTWFSTSLIDALHSNIVPVTISAIEDVHVQDMIINMRSHCLSWVEDRQVLNELVSGKVTVAEVVSSIASSATAC